MMPSGIIGFTARRCSQRKGRTSIEGVGGYIHTYSSVKGV